MSKEQADTKRSVFRRICKKVYSLFKKRAPEPPAWTGGEVRDLGEALVANFNRNVLKEAENESPRQRMGEAEFLEAMRKKADESRDLARQAADGLNEVVLKRRREQKNPQSSKE